MPEFYLGQRAQYVSAQGVTLASGTISRITPEWVVLDFPEGSDLVNGTHRAFNLDGSVPSVSGWTSDGFEKANARGARLEPLGHSEIIYDREPNPMLEYPPEPVIGYGVFDHGGRPILPGAAGTAQQAGYGILNPPKDFSGVVTDDRDSVLLSDYLQYARTQWVDEKLLMDFDAIPNKWEPIIGAKVKNLTIYSDQVMFTVMLPGDHSWRSVVINYAETACVTGIMSAQAVMEAGWGSWTGDDIPTLDAIEDEILTFSNGARFSILPRYLHLTHKEPTWVVDKATRKMMVRNLDMQRAARDSAEPLAA